MNRKLWTWLLAAALVLLPTPVVGGGARVVEVTDARTYPELRVHGRPFFPHSAAFFYYRIPRELWSRALDRHRELGLNTIDIYIPWNWHEPAAGRLDFDGHSNPRRDLRGLLRLLRLKGFALMARPGPVILNEWRNGGYPDWLLARPEFDMPAGDVLEGRYAPLSGLGTRDAERAAELWLANATHLRYTRRWFAAVAAELARFQRAGGVLLGVQLDDDQAIGRTNPIGPHFWRYMETLRRFLAAGFRRANSRLDVPVFFNPTDPRLPAAGFDSALPSPIAVMGQWYEERPRAPTLELARLGAEDRATIEFFAETLALQPAFPPMIIEFQAGWYTAGDDAAPMRTDPRNTLLASRLLFAHGLRGLNYFPAMDTLTPAGYEVPWTNRSYAWDAALGLSGRAQERAAPVRRNGDLLRTVGPWLAATHKHADAGLIYPLSSFDQSLLAAPDIFAISRAAMRVAGLAERAGIHTAYVDPHYQPESQLGRYSVLLLSVFEGEKFAMSERATKRLESYVRRGGRLVFFPRLPSGDAWQPMLAEAGLGAAPDELLVRRKLDAGEVAWLRAEIPAAGEKADAKTTLPILSGDILRRVLGELGVRPALQVEVTGTAAEQLDATLLETNGATGASFIALANLDYRESMRVRLDAADPRGGGRMAPNEVFLPPADSLFLPLRLPLCSWGAECEEEIVWATAEPTGLATAEGELITTWYAPGPAEVALRLPERPLRVRVDAREVAFDFDEKAGRLRVTLPAGAPPLYRRELRILTGYEMELPAQARMPSGQLTAKPGNAVAFPVREGVELESEPPLVPMEGDSGSLSVEIHNRSGVTRSLELSVAGQAVVLGRTVHVEALAYSVVKATVPLKLRPGVGPGLHRAMLGFGYKSLASLTIFLAVRPPGRAIAYHYDLDRDGFPDWILENDEARLVVLPAAGARGFVLLDKHTGVNWFTNAGGLRDHFAFYRQPERILPQRRRGMYGLHNRPYHCEAAGAAAGASVAIRCAYEPPDVLPAGARLVKTITLEGRTVAADYAVRLGPGGDEEARAAQAFLAVASLAADPATAWQIEPAGSPAKVEAHVPGPGEVAETNAGRLRLERRGAALVVDFAGASATLERKAFSIWLKIRYPALKNGSGQYRLRYELVRSE